MVNEDLTGVLECLRAARADGQPWHVIARLIQDRIASYGNWGSWRELWEKAQDPAGVSAVMLQRYVSTLLKLERIAADHGRDIGELLPSSFTGTEVALRIYDRKPGAGLKALLELRDRHVTIDDLRSELERMLPTDIASLRRGTVAKERKLMIDDCWAALVENASRTFGEFTTVEQRPVLQFFRRTGFDVRDANSNIIAGVDLYLAEPVSRTTHPLQTIAQTVLLSEYMPSFWLMLGPGNGEPIARTAADVLAVLAPQIGILQISQSGELEIRRKANVHGPISRAASYSSLIAELGRRPLKKKAPPNFAGQGD